MVLFYYVLVNTRKRELENNVPLSLRFDDNEVLRPKVLFCRATIVFTSVTTWLLSVDEVKALTQPPTLSRRIYFDVCGTNTGEQTRYTNAVQGRASSRRLPRFLTVLRARHVTLRREAQY